MATGLLVSVAAVSSAEPAYERQCHETPVRVSHSNGADADLVCAAATQAIDFMRRQGFRIAAMMPVRVLDEPLITFRDGELGRFDGGRLETSILSFEAARVASRDDPPFGIAMNEHLYRSFVVHELAHAIAHPSFEVGRPSVEAQEYIAYSAQLATMHPPLRRAILHHYRLEAFASESEITELYYAFDPAAFGVKAYLHFDALLDTQAFYRRLLTGEFQRRQRGRWR